MNTCCMPIVEKKVLFQISIHHICSLQRIFIQMREYHIRESGPKVAKHFRKDSGWWNMIMNFIQIELRDKNKTSQETIMVPSNNLLSQWLNFQLFGITYLVGKIKFKLFFQGPLAEWDNYSSNNNISWNLGGFKNVFFGLLCFCEDEPIFTYPLVN